MYSDLHMWLHLLLFGGMPWQLRMLRVLPQN